MIQFNTLKISSDGKELIIDAAVKDLEYYNGILIESVAIDNQDTYSSNGISEKPLFKYSFSYKDPSTGKVIPGKKAIHMSLDYKTLEVNDLREQILYVYLTATGTPSADTPCGEDNSTVMGVAVSLNGIYNEGIQYIKEVEKTCEIPKTMIDYICKFKAFELALKTKNFIHANLYWNKFFKKLKSSKISGCGCNK